MGEIPSSNVIDLLAFKREKEEQKEIIQTHTFEALVTGQLSYDSLDDFIEDMEEKGFEVEVSVFPDITNTDTDKVIRAND